MDCQTFQNSISAAVDGYLPQDERVAFHTHGDLCPLCQQAYELELATKQLIHEHLDMVKTPGVVAEAIIDRLKVDRSENGVSSWRRQRWSWRSPARYAGATLAFAAVLLIVLLVKDTSSPPLLPVVSSSLIDILTESRANYRSIVDGQIQPQVVSHDMHDLELFFSGKTDFPLVFPVIQNVRTIGGVLNEHAGTKRAHLVYRHPKAPIYMYETCWKTVQAGTTLNLASNVIDALQRSGRYLEDGPDGTTSVIWTHAGTVCIAVSSMSRDELIATLGTDSISPAHPTW